jgi:hypothetical protein
MGSVEIEELGKCNDKRCTVIRLRGGSNPYTSQRLIESLRIKQLSHYLKFFDILGKQYLLSM